MALALVFPGQGSQSLGMLSELAKVSSEVEDTFSQASAVLGYDLWQLVLHGPLADLNQTDKTQPAMLVAGIAAWRCWQQATDMMPDYFAGHSLGEYSALVASGGLAFTDAVKLVAERGRFMQQAVPPGDGAMAAIIGLNDATVKSVCAASSSLGVVEVANFNSLGQVVIAGSTEAVKTAIGLAKEQGAKRAILLPVSVPSHCALMKPAAEKLASVLVDVTITLPQVPVIHNVSVTKSDDVDDIKRLLSQQLYSPVRWVDTVQWLVEQGVKIIVECGPGKVLTGLIKRIDKSIKIYPLMDKSTLDNAMQSLKER